jgi:hypothetical protein
MPMRKAMNENETSFEKPSDHKQIVCQFLGMVVSGKIDEAYLKYVSLI